MSAPLLEEYRWNNRLLLVFSPSAGDHRFRRMEALIARVSCALEDRDLVIGWFPGSEPIRLGERSLTAAEGDELRKHYGLSMDTFAVLLIGKDGGQKYRSDEVPDLREIFALIDTMPMRQQEMAADPDACNRAGEQ